MTMSSETATSAPAIALNEPSTAKSESLPGLQSPVKQQGQVHVQQRSGGAGDSKVLKLKGKCLPMWAPFEQHQEIPSVHSSSGQVDQFCCFA